MPTSNTACFQSFLNVLSRRFARQDILLVLDGAPNHRCGDLAVEKEHRKRCFRNQAGNWKKFS
jgi:hypothetical protein